MKAEYVDHMGSDLSVVNAARVSFGKHKTELDAGDEKLINYLAEHGHTTPFYHTAITLRMQAPLPVRTQSFKHKVGLTENEESRRYITTPPCYFIPETLRSRPDGSIKQGSGIAHPDSDRWLAKYHELVARADDLYRNMVTAGVCPEQARFVLPQATEVSWIWTGNLYSFANFFNKRTDPHAQVEIQVLAKMVGEVVAPLFPLSWKVLTRTENDT